MRSHDGQAAADYAAVLFVVAALLTVVGAVAAPGVGERVVAAVRTGICIVGGDICRDSDARAAGLSPCVTRETTTGTETALDVALLQVGEDGGWSVAIRSDGSAVVTRTEGRSLGATGGLGFSYSPIGLEVGANGEIGLARHSGRSWHFADVGAARRFLAAALRQDPGAIERVPPDERWHDLGPRVGGDVGASMPVLGSAGAQITAESAFGRRTGGGSTTLFYRSRLDDPELFATLPNWSSSGAGREALVELTSDRGGPRELLVRTARTGRERIEETVGRLDLRDPEVRARLEALDPTMRERLAGHGPWPSLVLDDVVRLAMERGTVERQVHAVDDRSHTFSAAARFGVALGLEHTRVDVRSRLTDASVWIAGAGPRRREDCLGR